MAKDLQVFEENFVVFGREKKEEKKNKKKISCGDGNTNSLATLKKNFHKKDR